MVIDEKNFNENPKNLYVMAAALADHLGYPKSRIPELMTKESQWKMEALFKGFKAMTGKDLVLTNEIPEDRDGYGRRIYIPGAED